MPNVMTIWLHSATKVLQSRFTIYVVSGPTSTDIGDICGANDHDPSDTYVHSMVVTTMSTRTVVAMYSHETRLHCAV